MPGDPIPGKELIRAKLAKSVVSAEPQDAVEVEVCQGAGETPRLTGLEPIFTGLLALSGPGMLVFAPAGEEVLLPAIAEGPHQVAIYRDGYPTSRWVVLIEGPGHDIQAG
jgi:hypothetical protein